MSPGSAAHERRRIDLRFAKMDYFHHSPPVKRSQFTVDLRD